MSYCDLSHSQCSLCGAFTVPIKKIDGHFIFTAVFTEQEHSFGEPCVQNINGAITQDRQWSPHTHGPLTWAPVLPRLHVISSSSVLFSQCVALTINHAHSSIAHNVRLPNSITKQSALLPWAGYAGRWMRARSYVNAGSPDKVKYHQYWWENKEIQFTHLISINPQRDVELFS